MFGKRNYVLSNGHSAGDFAFDSMLDEIAGEPHIRGWQQQFRWVLVETARDVFDWSLLDSLASRCQARGLYFILQFKNTKFAGSQSSAESWGNYFPSYLGSDFSPSGVLVDQVSATDWRAHAAIWRTEIMDRKINLLKALCQRYADNPFFEGLQIGETSMSVTNSKDPLWTDAGLITEMARMGQALVTAVPQVNYFVGTNFTNNQPMMADLMAQLAANRIGAGGPDAIVSNSWLDFTWGDSVFNGFEISQPAGVGGDLYVDPDPVASSTKSWPTSFVPDAAGIDYSNGGFASVHPADPLPRDKTARPVIPYNLAVQIPAGKEGTHSADDLAYSAIEWKGATHMNWIRIPSSQSAINWPQHFLPYLQGNPQGTVTGAPTSYPAVDES